MHVRIHILIHRIVKQHGTLIDVRNKFRRIPCLSFHQKVNGQLCLKNCCKLDIQIHSRLEMKLFQFRFCRIESPAHCLIAVIDALIFAICAGITSHTGIWFIPEHLSCGGTRTASCINHRDTIFICQLIADIATMAIIRATENNGILPD